MNDRIKKKKNPVKWKLKAAQRRLSSALKSVGISADECSKSFIMLSKYAKEVPYIE